MTPQPPRLAERLKTPPVHYSYQRHRREFMSKILLPVALSALALIGMVIWISIATFNQGGDVGRWAAISTIWVIIPMLVGGLVVLAILVGLIYGMARLLSVIPYYTGIAQDYVFIARGYIVRGADLVVKPILVLNGWLQTAKTFFERMTP